MNTVIPFSTSDLHALSKVGGKAFSLITLTREGLPVPPGFVLTVDFFSPWLSAVTGSAEWRSVVERDSDDVKSLAEAARARRQALRFTEHQKSVFDAAMSSLTRATGTALFSVRSSSPEEDLEGASFAGGYETTLGVTADCVEDAVRRSFLSAFDERVLLYKREQGFDVTRPMIAVVVQQQIAADTAGVAFSLNPLNNCYDEAVINAAYGLGESVVSGEVEPDLFVVDKVDRKIVETQIGGKELAITIDQGGGTRSTSRSPDPQPCLDPDQVLELTDALVQIERLQGIPIDVEWAFAGGELHVLQARPITGYLPLPDEMITLPGERKYLYADSTLIEQGVDKPLSVLGIDFVRHVLAVMAGMTGGTVDSVDDIAFTAGGRYYMNLSHSLKLLGRTGALAPGSAGDESIMRIIDSIDLGQYVPEDLPERLQGQKRAIAKQAASMALPMLRAAARPEAYLRKYHDRLARHLAEFDHVIDPGLDLRRQAPNLTALLEFFFQEFGAPMLVAPQMAMGRMRKLFANEDVAAELLAIGTALPGNTTTAMGAAMAQLAASPLLAQYDSAEDFSAAIEQRAFDTEFMDAWDAFIAEYGARCPREIDVATPRPNEDPALLFPQLKTLALSERDGSSAHPVDGVRKREAARQELHRVASGMGRWQASAFDYYYRVWVTLGGRRENGKHYIVKVVDLFRKRVLQIAADLVAEGRLDEPSQIFDLTIEDIDRGLEDAGVDLRSLAAQRSSPIRRIARSPIVARVLDSRGRVFYPPHAASGEDELVGVPISPGVVRGRVKVLATADEKPILPGEILVARATDPGWTPLFISAGGVILEIGGALQHGAVVAREYGLPCVSGLHGATDVLTDGQLVEVDGAIGVVRVLSEDADVRG